MDGLTGGFGHEAWVIGGIIIAQLGYAIYAVSKVMALHRLIPDRKYVQVGREEATENYLADEAEEVGEGTMPPSVSPNTQAAEASPTYVLVTPKATSPVFQRIVRDINQYSRNKLGSVTDFALVKDVVDRPVDAELAQAEQRVSTPLYLGLIGAIAGIVAGIWALSSGLGEAAVSGSPSAPGDTVPDAFAALTGNLEGLLRAVALAMTASGLGVLITLMLSLITRRAEAVVDARRNDFFTFYQVEFLPKVSNNIETILQSLTNTLGRFNTGFGVSIQSLENSLGSNLRAVESQAEVLRQMREISSKGIVGETAQLYTQLVTATEKLEGLQPHIERTSTLMRSVGEAGEKFHATAGTVERLGKLETDIREIVEHSVSIQSFMSRHMVDMDHANMSALSVSQQIVEAFKDQQEQLRHEMVDVSAKLKAIAQSISITTRESMGEAQEKLAGLTHEIDGMVRTAFDGDTVNTIKNNTRHAGEAAAKAVTSAKQTEQLAAMIEASATRQADAMNAITDNIVAMEVRSRQHTETIQRLITRPPWYRRLFTTDKQDRNGQG